MMGSAIRIDGPSSPDGGLSPRRGRPDRRSALPDRARLALSALVLLLSTCTAAAQTDTLTVGVLAYRGEQHALDRWQATIDYLSEVVPGWKFQIEPLALEGVAAALEEDRIDFLFTNPGNYVASADRYELAPIATVRTDAAGQRQTGNRFGAVIFCRSDAEDIHAIGDLRGKTLAAVSPDAFGGFLVAAGTLLRQDIDPFHDVETLRFLGLPQDQIVAAVLSGAADAGVVRTGVIEAMAAEGTVDLSTIRILNTQSVVGFDYLLSTELFPEWVFAATRMTPPDLRNAVAVALLAMESDHAAAQSGSYAGWTTPMNHGAVRRLFAAVEQARSGDTGFSQGFMLATALPAVAIVVGIAVWLSRRRPSLQPAASVEPGPQPNDKAQLAAYRLTPREQQVLGRILAGDTNKEIAINLGISPKTVEFHRTHIMQKTKAGSVAQLVQIVLGTPEHPEDSRAT